MDPKAQVKWEEFLDPEVMRERLISASIFIAGFESLKGSVTEDVRGFFWCGFDESGDKISPDYATKVLKRQRSEVYACLDWLKEMGAIDDADIATFMRVKNCRNRLAHELFSLIGSEGLPPDLPQRFEELIILVRKIGVWWVMNVEIPTNPEFDGKEVNPDEVTPGRLMGPRLLCDIALGDDKTSRYYLDELRKRRAAQSKQ
jgi:hypothetical protein